MKKPTNIEQAVSILKDGGIVIFPTDTAFGIGCRADKYTSVERLFLLRKRPLHQPTPVLVDSLEMAERYAVVSAEVKEQLIEQYWPGALTIIMPAKETVLPLLQKNGGVGLRIPNHPTIRQIIRELGVPVLGPSANFHGEPTPYNFTDLDPELVKFVDFVVEGECTTKEASTVISTLSKPWEILRQGAVKVSMD